MKKRITRLLAILSTLAIAATCLTVVDVASYASEVDTTQAEATTSTEETTEQAVKDKKDEITIGGVTYKIINKRTKKAKVISSLKNIETATIKSTVKIDGVSYKVTLIAPKSFANRKALKKVTIGKNIKGIGKKVFYKDAKLKTVTFKGKNLIIIDSNSFKGTYKKIVIRIPKKVFKKYKLLLKKTGMPKKAKLKKY